MGNTVLQPDTEFIKDLMAAGAEDVKKCYQCATCSVACELGDGAFPRRQMVAAQWGQKEKLLADPAPWLCFYCGECSKRCPRQANPGETMMALRRYATAQYDWTGLARRMYGSAVWEIGVLLLVAAMVIALFTVPQNFGFGLLRQHPEALQTVRLDLFAPKHVVHRADWIMAIGLALLLLSNALRMFRALTRGKHVPLGVWLACLPGMVADGLTQRRWAKCGESRMHWLRHLVLVTGYGTIFTLVVIFLPWFQVEDTGFHWTSLLGYYSTVVLLGSTGWILLDRMGKRSEMHRFSELSDWLFPVLLFLTALSGIALHIVRLANEPMATYTIYTVHLAIAAPMLIVEVPFGKWAHLLYRPLALYIAAAVNRSEAMDGYKE